MNVQVLLLAFPELFMFHDFEKPCLTERRIRISADEVANLEYYKLVKTPEEQMFLLKALPGTFKSTAGSGGMHHLEGMSGSEVWRYSRTSRAQRTAACSTASSRTARTKG